MREILFRGKTPSDDEYTDCGEWVEGYYTRFNGNEHRIYSGYAETDCGDYYPDWSNVIPETVGQFTGVTDKNGKRIFEGDIVQSEISGGAYDKFVFPAGVIVFEKGSFCIKDSKTVTPLGCYAPRVTFEIIGNVHDNPELLN